MRCDHCLYGCDIGGSCTNSTCSSKFYGNTCNKVLPQPGKPILGNLSKSTGSCVATIAVNASISPDMNINQLFLLSANDPVLSFNDLIIDRDTRTSMSVTTNPNRYETQLIIPPQNPFYRLAAYFIFEDISLYGTFNSSVSEVYRTAIFGSNCTSTDNPNAVPTTSTTTSTTSSTRPSTITTTKSPHEVLSSSETTSSSFIVTSSSNQNSMVTNLSSISGYTYISVIWSQPNNVIGLVQYTVYIYPANQTINVSLNDSKCNFTGLTPSLQYTIYVSSVYSPPRTVEKSIIVSTLNPSSPTITDWNKGYTNGTISWNRPVAQGLTGYKVYKNDVFYIGTSDITTTQYLILNLTPATQYTITISAIYEGTANSNSTVTVYTKPYQFLKQMSAPVIYNITESSFQVTFPSYDTYAGTINLYYIAIQKASSSRRKRAALNCQLPSYISISNADVVYAKSDNSSPIAVGFGKASDSNCQNDKLTPNTTYSVFAIIGSTLNGTSEYVTSSSVIQTKSSGLSATGLSGGAIAAIVIGILLLIILIILLIWFMICRKRKEKLLLYNSANVDEKPSTYMFWSSIVDRMQPRKIILNDKNIFEGLNFKDEYDNLPLPDCDEKCHGGTHNLGYSVDAHSCGLVDCHIDGYSKKNAFIGTYFPIGDQSINDFWFMVYSDNIGQIVMLSEVDSMMKDSSYFPEKTEVYDYIEVTLVKERHYADFDIRIFETRKIDTKEKIEVTQYHYRSWPSNDKFSNHVSFLEFHEIVKKQESIIFGPTLVQCQQGSHLNTLYIGFDILMDRLNQEEEVNVYEVFGQLIKYRQISMININQYMLVYDFLFEAYLCTRFAVSCDINKIVNQIELDLFIEKQHDYLIATHQRIHLNKIRKNDYDIYDSIDISKSIILTPSPKGFHEAFINFWDAVFNNEVTVIVDLVNAKINEINITSQEMSKYKISTKDTRNCSNNVTIQVISVTNVYTNQIKNLTLYSTQTGYTLNYTNKECASWVELIYNMITNLDYNIIIFKDEESVLSSFVFLACFNAAVKFQCVGFVSVYYIVKSLLLVGQSNVPTLEQYQIIVYFLQMWIDLEMYNKKEIADQFNSMNMLDTFKWGPYKHMYHSLNNLSPKRSQKGHKKSPNYKYPS